MTRAIHGAPAEALRQALNALAELSFWIGWTADPDLYPTSSMSAESMRNTARGLRKSADLLDAAARQEETLDEGRHPLRTDLPPPHRAEETRMIRRADELLKQRWRQRFADLPPPARQALRAALLDLRAEAADRAELQWRRNKAVLAMYWKTVSVYAGHLARALR